MVLDDITQAVLAHDDVARYLRGGRGESNLEARERIHTYIEELRTTQRYPFYRGSSIRSTPSFARSRGCPKVLRSPSPQLGGVG